MQATRVLLIEDDLVFQSVVQQYLTQRGYQVTVATDGEQGVALCVQEQPDIVLCDLILPNMSGLQVLEHLVTESHDIPVIVISASEKMAHIREAVRLGAWDYLVKPLNNLDLVDDAIHNCLDRHQLESAQEREVWELDSHIDVLYQDDNVVQRLAADLVPTGSLDIGHYQLQHEFGDADLDRVLVDYRHLTDGKALVVMAAANAVADQSLISLLVLKTLINPLVRQCLAGSDSLLLQPEQVMMHLNAELCHSKIRTAYDVVIGILDTHTDIFTWSQAGEKIKLSQALKPDLSLGIWQQAAYRPHQHQFAPGEHFLLQVNEVQLHLRQRPVAA